MIRGRFFIAAFAACAIVLSWAAPVRPAYNTKAERMYAAASRRLEDLKKSPKKRKYRSYWIDSARTFELVEKKYPKSPQAGNACFDRAGVYWELYRYSGFSRDRDEALRTSAQCQARYPTHVRASRALHRVTKPSARGKTIPGGVVQKIRYRSGGDYTRIVIDHENKVKFKVLELKNPDRLVFDLLNAQLDPSVDSGPLMVNDGILRQVRASQYTPDIVRVVLDLASINNYAAFPLRDPRRLVIDVMGKADTGDEYAVAASGQKTIPASRSGPQDASASRVEAPEAKGRTSLSLSRQLGLKVRTIAIDAGHGGRDPGAIGRRGTKEKDITLDIAKRLAALVKEGLGCAIIMTRERDEFIPLEDRSAIARTKGADLFVSIHVNASRRSRARGIETYIQGLRASDRDAMATAARENATTSKTLSELDDELAKILTGLRMESSDEDSIHLAHAVQGALVDAVKPVQGHVVDLGVKRAFFYVLINTAMPSILAEVGFISNLREEKLLMKETYRQAIAEALFEGVKKYVESREPQMAAT